MAAYVEKLGRRDEIAELIERHFEVPRVFLPDDQANGTRSRPGRILGLVIHHGVLLSDRGWVRTLRRFISAVTVL
jgi:hypothetical protein